MWWWWIFTFIRNCVSIFWFIAKNAKNPKMSFNGQPNMFFGKLISYTCDLHLKLDILNPLNIIFWSNSFLRESFDLQPFLSKFQKLWNFCMIWFFIKIIQWTCTLIKGACFCCIKSLNSIVWLHAFLLILKKKCNLDTWYS